MGRKCPHGEEVGPLDDYGKGPDEPVKSVYCEQCNPRIVPRPGGGYTNAIEYQYLTSEEKRLVSGVDPDEGPPNETTD